MNLEEALAALAATQAENARLNKQVDRLSRQVEHLTRVIERLSTHLGVPPEPTAPTTDAASPEEASAPPPKPLRPPKQSRTAPGHGRRRIPEHLPVDLREIHPPACDTCGSTNLRELGEEITNQIDYVPGYVRNRRTVRHTCACRACGALTTAAAPPTPIDKGSCTAAFLAHVVHSKYTLHLPLERLRGELRRGGVDVPISTLCGWVTASAFLFEPVVRRMKHHLLAGKVVQTDGTGLQVLRRGQRRAHFGQMAVYCSPRISVFAYTATKEGKHAVAFLDGYEGVLVADAASTFDQVYAAGKILEAGCWAHARRKFEEALDHSAAAHEAVAFVAALYDVEHDIRDRSLDRAVARRERALPILAAFEAWLAEQAQKQLPKSPAGKAIAYVRRHWIALNRFAADARLPLDNNLSERQLRSVAVGRSNYVFAGSEAGAVSAATLYSIVQTCKLNDIDPYEYVADVLNQLALHPTNRRRGGDGIDELLPWKWKERREQQQRDGSVHPDGVAAS